MTPAGFVIPANGRPQTHAWYRAATGVGLNDTADLKTNGNDLCSTKWFIYDKFSGQNYLEILRSPHSLPSKKCKDDLES